MGGNAKEIFVVSPSYGTMGWWRATMSGSTKVKGSLGNGGRTARRGMTVEGGTTSVTGTLYKRGCKLMGVKTDGSEN